nr:hypothetical protein CFP56_50693 [Quercus suber]
MGSITKGQIYCSHDFEQQHIYAESLGNGVKELKNILAVNEAQNEFPSLFNPNLLHTHKETNTCHIPSESVHKDPFQSKLAKIDEGLSKLNARLASNFEVARKEHLSHVVNEEVKAARVCHAQNQRRSKKKKSRSNKGLGNM